MKQPCSIRPTSRLAGPTALVALVGLALLGALAGAAEIQVDYDSKADFTRCKTWSSTGKVVWRGQAQEAANPSTSEIAPQKRTSSPAVVWMSCSGRR